MSILSEITRIRNLRNRLITKLRSMSLLDSSAHDLEDAVDACENLGSNLETKSVTLNENTPTTPVTPSSGYSGMDLVKFEIDGNAINPSFIIKNNTIVGVEGVAITGTIEMRRASFEINNISDAKSMTIDISQQYSGSGQTYLQFFPEFNELMLFKRNNSFQFAHQREVLTLFHNIINGYGEWTAISSNGSFTHIGDSQHSNLVTYTYTDNRKKLTITLGSQLDVFNGNYVLYIYY